MTKLLSAFATLLISSTLMVAQADQTVKSGPDRAGNPYSASQALQDFAAGFAETNVGFLHIYADPNVDPKETYLMRGTEASGTLKALLPAKFQRMAQSMNATVFGSAAIRGLNENMFIVRMDGPMKDRLELFAIRGNKVKHLKTLAYRNCTNGKCEQLDSYITDIDGDTVLDLVQISRTIRNSGVTASNKKVFVLKDRSREWKRTNQLDVPWNSIKFYDPTMDKQ